MSSGKAAEAWRALNERRRLCLSAIYDADQARRTGRQGSLGGGGSGARAQRPGSSSSMTRCSSRWSAWCRASGCGLPRGRTGRCESRAGNHRADPQVVLAVAVVADRHRAHPALGPSAGPAMTGPAAARAGAGPGLGARPIPAPAAAAASAPGRASACRVTSPASASSAAACAAGDRGDRLRGDRGRRVFRCWPARSSPSAASSASMAVRAYREAITRHLGGPWCDAGQVTGIDPRQLAGLTEAQWD